jgi:manganese-dependent ADP-ribose/CDP-alcohol diphosphatase
LKAFDEFQSGPVYHLLGNHCLYHLTRDVLHPKLSKTRLNIFTENYSSNASNNSNNTNSENNNLEIAHHYFSFSPHPSVRFIALDSYDVSLLGWTTDHPHYKEAVEFLEKNNPNILSEDEERKRSEGGRGRGGSVKHTIDFH